MNNETCGKCPANCQPLPPFVLPSVFFIFHPANCQLPTANSLPLRIPHFHYLYPPMRLEKNLPELFEFLSTPRNIALVAHTRPDGDAIGSCLALKFFLEKRGHTAEVIAPDDFPDFLNWMKGSDKVFIRQKNPKTCFAILANSDLIGFLDFNALKRIESLGEDIAKIRGKKWLMVDHHRDPDDFTDFTFWSDEASSTCELVYDLIRMMDGDADIDTDMAAIIYAGMAMDTGVFQYSNTTARVHEIAANLMHKGIHVEEIHNNVYNQYGENRLRFIGYMLKDKMQILPEYRTAFMTISMKEAEEYKLSSGDKEGIVNLPLAMKDVDIAVLFTEDKDRIKISFRSKGDINVDRLAREYFNGGGHKNASGGSTRVSLEETVQILHTALAAFLS
ncbi:MAG TPA: DHH family phosphoesterase [Bacteroidetes bacterium]|nr:DHH family phosphoesterase [Bacteroidota bacterium]